MHVFSRRCHIKMSRMSSDTTHWVFVVVVVVVVVVFCWPFVVMYASVSQQKNLSVWLEIVWEFPRSFLCLRSVRLHPCQVDALVGPSATRLVPFCIKKNCLL